MARVGVISIDLIANTGKLLSPLKKSGAAIASFASGVKSMHSGLGGLVAKVGALTGGLVTTYTVISRVKKAFGEVDEIAKLSDRLGIGTEQLIGLQHAAGLAGISTEELTTALEFMTKKGRSVEGIGIIADDMAALTSATDRAELAVKLFGKSGIKMVNVLAGGSKGLQEMQEDAQKLGLTLSRVDAAKVELAGDAISRIGSLFDGVARKIAVELSPFIQAAADAFVNLGVEGTGWAGKVRAAVDFAVSAVGAFADALFTVQVGWKTFQLGGQIAMSGVVTAVAFLTKQIEMFSEAVVTGFRFMWGQASQIVAEAIGIIIGWLAEFATWVESQLPEKLRIGLGASAMAFSDGFAAATAEARKTLDATDFSVDFTFGDTAQSFAKTLSEDVDRTKMELARLASSPLPSVGIRRGVEEMRAAAERAAESIAKDADIGADVRETKKPAALERGSQEAFASFTKSIEGQRNVDEKILEEERKAAAGIKKLVELFKGGLVLGVAPL